MVALVRAGAAGRWIFTQAYLRSVPHLQHPNAGLMLGHRRRRWPNIKPTLGQCICRDLMDSVDIHHRAVIPVGKPGAAPQNTPQNGLLRQVHRPGERSAS